MAILGILVVLAQVSSATCGSREMALVDLGQHVAKLVPGRPLQQIKQELGDSLVVLDSDPSTRQVFLLVGGRDRTLHAAQRLDCDLDRDSRLVGCKKSDSPYLTRHVAQADWERIGNGDSLRSVYARICDPSDPVLGSPPATQLGLEYMVILTKPTAHYNSCAARLLVERDAVVKKELRCE
jgi:hypothetical protein